MKLKECMEKLNNIEHCVDLINQNECSREINAIYIGDLLSHVMANGKDGALWLTVQRHLNVIAVAELNDFSAIIFVEGVMPETDTIQKAIELNIPLLTSKLDAYHLVRNFVSLGL